MKTSYLSDSHRFAPSTAVFLLGFALALSAQPTPPVGSKGATASATRGTAQFDLYIADGKLLRNGKELEATLGNVVEVLRERYTNANLAISPSLAALKITDLKFRGGQLWEALEALRVASGEGFDWFAPNSGGPNMPPVSGGPTIDPTTGLPGPQAVDVTGESGERDSNRGLYVLRERPPKPERQRIIEAINLSGYLDWYWNQAENPPQRTRETSNQMADRALNELLQMVRETTSEFIPTTGPEAMPMFRFHPGANLLIVVGTPRSVELVRKLVAALPGQGDTTGQQGASRSVARSSSQGWNPEVKEAYRPRYGIDPGGAPAPQPAKPTATPPPR